MRDGRPKDRPMPRSWRERSSGAMKNCWVPGELLREVRQFAVKNRKGKTMSQVWLEIGRLGLMAAKTSDEQAKEAKP